MQVYAAINAAPGPGTGLPRVSATQTASGQSLLLTESAQSLGGPPSLFEALSPRERETVLQRGRRKVLYRGQTLFNQGAKHDGIYLIETGRIRVFYTAPSGREITLAYWHPGTFVGEDFAQVLNYEFIVGGIKSLVDGGHVELVETLAERVAALCLEDKRAIQATVTVEKLDVYPEAKGVGVQVIRRRPRGLGDMLP